MLGWGTKRFVVAGAVCAVAGVGAGVGVYAGRGGFRSLGPPGSPERVIAERCRSKTKDDRQDCYLKGLEARLEESGVAGAMATLKALAANDTKIDREGHVYAHGVGIKGYLRAKEVPATFGQCPTDFASGCGHGVIQAYLESQQSLDSTALNGLCAPYRGQGEVRWQLFQCVHGIGHGLVMMYRGELPQALGDCDRLESGWDRDSCYGGAFMENIMRVTAPHHPATELAAGHEHHQAFKALDSTDLLYPCSIVENRYHRACYEIQTAAILHFTKGKVDKASAACDTAPETMRPTCYTSLGRDISSKALRDPGRTLRYCRQTGEHHRPWCYFGAAKALIDWEASPTAGIAFCARLGEDPGAPLCFRAVGEQIAALEAALTERERICGTAARPEAIAACRWAAAVPGSVMPANVGQVTTVFPTPLPAMSAPESSARRRATEKSR